MTAKKTTKTATTRIAKPARKAKPADEAPGPQIIDAGGGILVEIAPPPARPAKARPAKKTEPRLVEGSLSAAFREAGDIHGISDPPEPPARKKTKPATETKSKKMSALDAAAKVLAEAGEAMTCQEMIEAMAAKGLWTSPGGKTPSQTLYSAILREVAIKGTASRFQKTERGRFTRTN